MELLRFGLVAVLGLGLDLGVAWTLAVPVGLPIVWAAAAGFGAGALLNYALHELWTFQGGARRLSAARAARYGLALGATLLVRLIAVAVLAGLLPGAAEIVILAAATGISFFVNYAVSRSLVFRATASESARK